MQTTRSSILRLLAIVLFLLTTTLWFAGGAHRGWTQTRVTEMHVDEFTGIEYPVQHAAFVPGVEFLGAGFLTAALVGGASFIGTRRKRVSTVDLTRPTEA